MAQCANGREACAAIRQHQPDLMFLDIQMPGMSGFEVLAQLPQESLPLVVFVTAYDQYAIQAFEARAIDYLLKPIDEARFNAALARVREHLRSHSAESQRDRLLRSLPRSPARVSWRSMSCSRRARRRSPRRGRKCCRSARAARPSRARRRNPVDRRGGGLHVHP